MPETVDGQHVGRWLLAAAIVRGLFGVLQFLLPE
jgi:hypothetical protein